jgi:phage tail sheath protein FI
MVFQLSPGVNVSEIDLTTVVPAVATSDGAIGGVFRWGPIGERVLIDSENLLAQRFGKPTNFNAETFFTAGNFLAYGNRLYVSRAGKTTGSTPQSYANTTAETTPSNVFTTNTSGLEVGMYVTQASNNNILNASLLPSIVSLNATSITLSSAASINTSANVLLYFARSDATYSAVAVDASNTSAVVANLVNQIVKNENEYDSKDGNFDLDVLYVAKYPGALGNSLRVAVCDNSNSFNSNVPLANATVDTFIKFEIGSTEATVKFVGSTNATANVISSNVAIGDYILAGNSTISSQYLRVTEKSISGNATANIAFDGSSSTNVNLDTNFIIANNSGTNGTLVLADGDAVVYANATGNSAIGGLSSGTTYYVRDANTSGLKLAADPNGAVVDITGYGGESHTLLANTSTLTMTFQDPYRLRENYTSTSIDRYWEFFNVVETTPGQSSYQLANGNTAAQDELHVVVVDDAGGFTGTPGTILEVYKGVSRATDAKNVDGSINYYKDVINQNSQYVWWTADRSGALSATATNLTSTTTSAPSSMLMRFGSDGLSESNATLSILGEAYDLFVSTEDIDISLVLQGKPIGGVTVVDGETISNYQLANYIIDNICEVRKDCVALISPDKDKVLNNVGREALSLKNWRGALRSTSYAVLDSGYKYQYDRYNDLYRWVPLNGDIAGLCVRTDSTNDAWWSPAGFNRGQIKNIVKLAWNPRKAERDVLYSNGVNPVVTFPGQGTVLFGDKTLQAKPSAFDRINVRRLFIVLEKAISRSAKFSLFEFNDAFTRAQFKNLVTPYLRTIQGRRGITDFLVVCDETNNTPAIIDSNQFVGDIYIKPARSINYIQLNFVAVGTGVQFSEVVGKF